MGLLTEYGATLDLHDMGMVNHRREMHRVAVSVCARSAVSRMLSSLTTLACLTAYSRTAGLQRERNPEDIYTHHLLTYLQPKERRFLSAI